MAKRGYRWFWLTRRDLFDDMPAHAALDLLRYDAARVESNAPPGYYLFSSDGELAGPQVQRLRTYHAEPTWQTRTAVDPDYGRSQAWEHYHAAVAAKVSRL